jgi:hypothetical protein
MTSILGVTGSQEVQQFVIDLELPNKIKLLEIPAVESQTLGFNRRRRPFDFIIGMDVIQLGDFAFTNVRGRSMVSFRIPSIANIDYEAE